MSNKAVDLNSLINAHKERDYFVHHAKLILENGRLHEEKINTDNPDDVIAALYVMLINEQVRNKELERELGFMMDV